MSHSKAFLWYIAKVQNSYHDYIRLQISQELRMLSSSLSDCKSLTLNIMIQVLQYVSNSQLCYLVTNSLYCSHSKSK